MTLSPFWSVMIPVRNRPDFLHITLQSVLANKIPADMMQIEVIDNSTVECGVKKITEEIGKGRIDYYKQPEDLSMGENWNSCIKRARGKYIHILHDDDYVAPSFYDEFYRFICTKPGFGLYYCSSQVVDEKGQFLNVHRTINPYEDTSSVRKIRASYLSCPEVVISRDCCRQLSNLFNPTYSAIVDQDMWARLILAYNAAFLDKYLAFYRFGNTNETSRNIITGKNLYEEEDFLHKLKEHGIVLSPKDIQSYMISAFLEQAIKLKKSGNMEAANHHFKIFRANTNIFNRQLYALDFFLTKSSCRYYFFRFFFYLFQPWKINKYFARQK